MSLQKSTMDVMRKAHSYRMKNGFRSEKEIVEFWNRYGAIGFLNIKEVTPSIVQEIRTRLIEKK